MNVNYNVIISLLTHRKFVSNEEWGILQDATEYLLQEHIEEWKKENGLIPYPIYDKSTNDLIAKYILSEHAELEELYNIIETGKDNGYTMELISAYRKQLPDSYTITPIPASFKLEKEKTQ